MIKPDIIIAWPNNCDYPLWRQFIRDNRSRFNLVIIVFTETNQAPNYTQFVRDAMNDDYVLFIDNPPIQPGQDWRDVAVKQALIHSFNSEWVWFTEQDFLIEDDILFWGQVQHAVDDGMRAIGVLDSTRLHPCCLFLRRDLLDFLALDFAANPPEYDHFGSIQKDLELLGEDIEIIPEELYYHFNGLSHNWRLMAEGGLPNYRPEMFNQWLKDCLEVSVPLDEGWVGVVKTYFERIKA